MSELTHLERAVMQKLLEGEDEDLRILREQLDKLVVTDREMTGAGFYTTFSLSDAIQRLPRRQSFKFGDVIAEVPGLRWGAGFLLYVQDGALHMLEGYSYDEPWPQQISDFVLRYTTGDQRDMTALRKILSGKK